MSHNAISMPEQTPEQLSNQTPCVSPSDDYDDYDENYENDTIFTALPWWVGMTILMPAVVGVIISMEQLNLLPEIITKWLNE